MFTGSVGEGGGRKKEERVEEVEEGFGSLRVRLSFGFLLVALFSSQLYCFVPSVFVTSGGYLGGFGACVSLVSGPMDYRVVRNRVCGFVLPSVPNVYRGTCRRRCSRMPVRCSSRYVEGEKAQRVRRAGSQFFFEYVCVSERMSSCEVEKQYLKILLCLVVYTCIFCWWGGWGGAWGGRCGMVWIWWTREHS